MFTVTDVIIIGGGAAGLCSAVYLKKRSPQLSVRIIEALPRVGKKLALTGNGRCNITNKKINLSRYHGEEADFCRFALEKYDLNFCADFFESIGVPFVFEDDKGYPASLQAASVVDCLRFAAEELGVKIHLETKVTAIQLSGGNYKVIADNMSLLCKNLIVASGLYSGGDRLGCDGSMLEIFKKAGYKAVKTTPAIVQLKTVTDVVKQLKGIKLDATVSLKAGGKELRRDFGEVLFCDYGLSGPPVMQVSREVSRTKTDCEICLDIMPLYSLTQLCDILRERVKTQGYRSNEEFFTGMLNKRVGQVVLKLSGAKLNDKASTITDAQIKKIVSLLKCMSFAVTGTTGFANSQVTAGGLSTSQFKNTSMMSRLNSHLYAIGEILDIDGDCGGFNLQWAWSSAMCAADDIIKGGKG